MSGTNQTPFGGLAGAPDGVVLVRSLSFLTLNVGTPVGTLAGQAGTSSVPPDMVWDWVGHTLWVCTLSGATPAATTWAQVLLASSSSLTDDYLETELLLAAALPLTTETPLTVVSRSLPAGQWLVWGTVGFVAAPLTLVASVAGTANTAAVLPDNLSKGSFAVLPVGAIGPDVRLPVGQRHLTLAEAQTIYLVAEASFGGGNLAAYGILCALRVH